MEKQIVTEEMHPEKEWFKEAGKMTVDKLPEFMDRMLNGYIHDYGTAVHAIAACALAAAWAASEQEGITGFQAGFVMWDFIRGWNHTGNVTGMKLLDYDDMLYPQFAHKYDRTISKSTWENIQKEARNKLAEHQGATHPDVLAHWQSIVNGVVPFGYRVVDD